MTNCFCVKYSLAAFVIVAFLAGNSIAQQIPDNSLPPSETDQTTISHDNAYQQYLNQNHISDPAVSADQGNNIPAVAANHFMDGYCDRNFKPAIASDPRYANIGDCLQQQKDKVCGQFQQLPDDAKQLLDQNIDCVNKLLNGDSQQASNTTTTCSDTDSMRLQLLKKYWHDQGTAEALIFMPDDVLDSASKCLHGGR